MIHNGMLKLFCQQKSTPALDAQAAELMESLKWGLSSQLGFYVRTQEF